MTAAGLFACFLLQAEEFGQGFGHADFQTKFKVRYIKQCEVDPALKRVIAKNVVTQEPLYKDNKEYYDDLAKKYGSLISRSYIGPVYVKYIGEPFGFGVFAKKAIKSGEMIGEYTGVICILAKIPDAKFAFDYPSPQVDGVAHEGLAIDAYNAGNITRFVNHSSDNANVYVETIPYKNRWHQVFCASRDIEQGEQLLIDYGSQYWDALGITPEPLAP